MDHVRVDLRKYVVLSIWHNCNSDCSICMLADVKSDMPVVGFDLYRDYVDKVIQAGRYESLILSGAEVTTFEDLEKYVRHAASTSYFKKIQIQTNGRRLSDQKYLQSLVDAGVNEFFVSLHGLEAVHDAVTRVPGSFMETMAGLANLEDLEVNVITNTVLTRSNLPDIVPLMDRLTSSRISEVHLWNYYPMEDTDTRDLIVSSTDLIGLLGQLLPVISQSGKPLILKSFPQCLSFGQPVYFDSGYPATIIPDLFWRKFSESGFGTCTYKERCGDRQCWGLSKAYIRKYGDERELLSPLRKKGQEIRDKS
jgi:hypothetical protein